MNMFSGLNAINKTPPVKKVVKKRGGGKAIDTALINKAAREYINGKITLAFVAEKYDINISTLHRFVMKKGGRKKRQSDIDKIILLSKTYEVSVVAWLLDFSESKVNRIIRQHKTQPKLGE